MKKEIIYSNDIKWWTEEEIEGIKDTIIEDDEDFKEASEEEMMDEVQFRIDCELKLYIDVFNKDLNDIIRIYEDEIIFIGNNLNDIFNNILDYNSAYWWYDHNNVGCTDNWEDATKNYIFREIKPEYKDIILSKQNTGLTFEEIENYTQSLVSYVKKLYEQE